jgi:hypothetical protein
MSFRKSVVAAVAALGIITAPAYATVDTWSTTAGSNLSVNGVSLAEGMAPSSVNDAIRGLMDEVATWLRSGTITFTSTSAGSGTGPTLDLHRDSASPAASDILGQVSFAGEDSGSAKLNYATIRAEISDPTDASEDATLILRTITGGTAVDRVTIAQGVQVGSPTGGDKGAGTGNFDGLIYKDGNVVPSVLVFSDTFNPGSLSPGGFGSTPLTITGAVTGDPVQCFGGSLLLKANVTSANTASLIYINPYSIVWDDASHTLTCLVFKIS